jgi:hypothetical protein
MPSFSTHGPSLPVVEEMPLPSTSTIPEGPETDSPTGRARYWMTVAAAYHQQLAYNNAKLESIDSKLKLRPEPRVPTWFKVQTVMFTVLVLLYGVDFYSRLAMSNDRTGAMRQGAAEVAPTLRGSD